jgi:hypothetical protein
MGGVTDANDTILVNLSVDASRAKLEFFSLEPAPLRVMMRRGDAVLFNDAVTPDPSNGNHVSAAIPAGSDGDVKLTIATADGRELIAATAAIK